MLDWLINTKTIVSSVVVFTFVLVPLMALLASLAARLAARVNASRFERETKRAIRPQAANKLGGEGQRH